LNPTSENWGFKVLNSPKFFLGFKGLGLYPYLNPRGFGYTKGAKRGV